MNKKVIFVEPTGAASNVFAKMMTIPLLGPLYLGTMAKQHGFDVTILNENILKRRLSDEELGSADILCLSCITATVNRGKQIAAQYRDIRSRKGLTSKVLFGGIHASMLPEDLTNHCDHVVTGEAEGIIIDLLNGAYNDQVIKGSPLEDLDSLPIPDYTLLQGWKSMDVIPVMTSRGCPYDCNFCSVTEMFGRTYRWQSPTRVLDEVRKVPHHVSSIFFTDDHFTANGKRTDELLDLLIRDGVRKTWNAQVRTEVTRHPELVAKMRKAGCRTVYVGFESVNPESLRSMHKNQSVDDIRRTIEVFKRNGIGVHGMFMLGNDPDTSEVFRTTAEFCKKSGIDTVQYTILTPLPGTPLYRQFETEGRLLHKDWTFYDGLHVVFKPAQMSAFQLQEGMIDCFSDFYRYTRAVSDGLHALYSTGVNLVRKFYTTSYLPSLFPLIMKVLGKGIVTAWVNQNRGYLKYLRTVSSSHSATDTTVE